MTPERCTFSGWQAPGAPRVWALPTPVGATRDAQRALARAALAQLLGVQEVTNQRGEPPRAPALAHLHLSLSHADGVSLLACHHGPVGVDVQAAPAEGDLAALQATAALFLGPNWHIALEPSSCAAINSIAFTTAWAAHEARLKCAQEPLVEWSPALAARLARYRATPLVAPALHGLHAALAWPMDGPL